jgi:predicted dehydrogenase
MQRVEGLEFASVSTATGLSAYHAADRFGFRLCATDERAVLDDPAVNLVVIATRHNLHARQVLAALDRGKHVFCEKPLALDETELRAIIAAYVTRRQGTLLGVGFNRRFAPMAIQMKGFLAHMQDPLAMHYRVNAGYLPADHWVHDPEQGGGRIIGEVCHFVDFLTFLAGAVPVRVQAHALPNEGRFRDDNVLIMLEFSNGSLGSISYVANGDRSFSKERVEVFGGGSVAVLDDFRSLELVRSGRTRGVTAHLRQDKGYRGEWEAFVAAAREGGSNLPIPFHELVSTTLTTCRIVDSLQTGEPTHVDSASFLAAATG